jgi:hypothetical protein
MYVGGRITRNCCRRRYKRTTSIWEMLSRIHNSEQNDEQDSCETNGRTCNILSNKSAIRQLSIFRRNIKGCYANML